MKLVVDIETISSNLDGLNTKIEDYSSALSSFNSASVNCSVEEVSGILDSYKSSINEDLNNLNNSSNEYNSLVKDCCEEYKSNEEKTQTINTDIITDIISNNTDVTIDYQGSAKERLTGLPSTDLVGAGTGRVMLDGTVVDTSNYVEIGNKYNLSDDDLAYLAYVAVREQGSVGGAKMELSLMASLYELHKNEGYSSVTDYVKNSGWFASSSRNGYEYPGDDYYNAAKEVLNDGHLYVPSNVIEHDYMGDIDYISTGSASNRDDYIPGETVIHNTMGATYTFIGFAPNNGDPFGYKNA